LKLHTHGIHVAAHCNTPQRTTVTSMGCVWDVNVICPIHTAIHRNGLQYTALQHTATDCSDVYGMCMGCECDMSHTHSTHRNGLQYTALQHTARDCSTLHCNTPQRTAVTSMGCVWGVNVICPIHTATHRNGLQHTALQHTTTDCSNVYGMRMACKCS